MPLDSTMSSIIDRRAQQSAAESVDLKEAGDRVTGALESKQSALSEPRAAIKRELSAPLPELQTETPPSFVPPKLQPEEVHKDMMGLFAVAMLGSLVTRAPATAALNSFAGAMQGYMKGDQTLFEKEFKTYQQKLSEYSEKNKNLISKYNSIVKNRDLNLQHKLTQLELAAAEANDPVMLEQARKGNIKEGIELNDKRYKTELEAVQRATHWERMFSSQMARNAAMTEQRELDRKSRERMAAERNEMKEKSQAQGGKPTASERQHYVDSNQLLKSVDRVTQMLANPELREKVDESRLSAALSESFESKVIQQFLVRPNIDQDVKKYLNEILMLRNQYYLDQSGKAVTGGEALRNYGAVVQPGDAAEDVLQKMGIASNRAREKMRDYETYFPSLALINKPAEGGKSGPSSKMKNDKGWSLHEDANGNRAYVGPNGEIEEIQ